MDLNHSFNNLSSIENIIDKQFSVLKNELMKMITEQLELMSNKISKVENRVSAIEKDWLEWKRAQSNDSNSDDNKVINVMTEMEEQRQRSCNVMLFGITESDAASAEDRIGHDTNQVLNIINPLGDYPKPKKIVRLGLRKSGGKRPLKITFNSEEEAIKILKSNKSNPNKELHFRSDLTLNQRNYNKKIREELKDRRSRGENNLKIYYKSNKAYITQSTSSPTISKN